MKFTEEQLARMSYKERENALELMVLEEQIEAPAPEPAPAEPSKEASPAPEPEAIPEPTKDPVPEVAPEPSLPEMSEETLDYWKAEAEKWKKRKGDADRALSPAQQKAASMKKELKTKEEEWKEIALSLKADLEELKKGLQREPVHTPAFDDSLISPEFEESYGDIAAELKREAGNLTKRTDTTLESRLAAIEERNKQLEREQLLAQDTSYTANHYAQLKALHPDIDDFIDPNKKGTQLFDWASNKPSYVKDVVLNPLNYTPGDVSDVLNRFKKDKGVITKKPSLGDVMVKANSVPNIQQPQEEEYLSDYEMKNFDSLMRTNNRDSKKIDELVRKYEATLTRNK